jgi:hypothetical protein
MVTAPGGANITTTNVDTGTSAALGNAIQSYAASNPAFANSVTTTSTVTSGAAPATTVSSGSTVVFNNTGSLDLSAVTGTGTLIVAPAGTGSSTISAARSPPS